MLLDESKIATTIDINCYLVECLGLANVIEKKVIPIKVDFVTIRNIPCVIYWKQDKLKLFYKSS